MQCNHVVELVRHLNSKICLPINENHDLDKDDLISILRKLENKRYACKYCHQLFAHSSSKTFHEQSNCAMQKSLKNTTIQKDNITNIFTEDFGIIPDSIIDSFITDLGSIDATFDIVGLVKHIHFNAEYPQFQNICKRNKKLGTLSVFQDGKWTEKACENIIKTMMVNVINLFKRTTFTNGESYDYVTNSMLHHLQYNKREYIKLRNFILIESDTK
jgi:hypothetical protein